MNTTEHLLVCLAEECNEVAQDCAKSLRFGLGDVNILNPTGPTNLKRLEGELCDLFAVVEMLQERAILTGDLNDREKIEAKKQKVLRFMEYARGNGTLSALP